MASSVDPYRFIDRFSKRVARSWSALEPERAIPWTPLSKPLSECTVSLISSAALVLRGDRPFDQQGERDDPWWGDPSHRVIPRSATSDEVACHHLHIHTAAAEQDLNCVLPIHRLVELEEAGFIGRAATSHYSFMGYQPRDQELLARTVPAIIEQLRAEQVDAVLLVPV